MTSALSLYQQLIYCQPSFSASPDAREISYWDRRVITYSRLHFQVAANLYIQLSGAWVESQAKGGVVWHRVRCGDVHVICLSSANIHQQINGPISSFQIIRIPQQICLETYRSVAFTYHEHVVQFSSEVTFNVMCIRCPSFSGLRCPIDSVWCFSDNDDIARFQGKQLGIPRGCSGPQQDIGE